jgi:serine O-acetyltransferase
MAKIRKMLVWLNLWRVLPAYLVFCTNKFRDKCAEDLAEWVRYEAEATEKSTMMRLGYFLVNCKECRNIFQNRLRRNPLSYLAMRVLFPPLESCYISMPPEDLGGGFSLQHGFSTIVSAKTMGKRCRVNQQVTIGHVGLEAPVIGDDVRISAGAIVIGGITVGSGSMIGAGSVVVKDVPENATVVGTAARVIKIRETV